MRTAIFPVWSGFHALVWGLLITCSSTYNRWSFERCNPRCLLLPAPGPPLLCCFFYRQRRMTYLCCTAVLLYFFLFVLKNNLNDAAGDGVQELDEPHHRDRRLLLAQAGGDAARPPQPRGHDGRRCPRLLERYRILVSWYHIFFLFSCFCLSFCSLSLAFVQSILCPGSVGVGLFVNCTPYTIGVVLRDYIRFPSLTIVPARSEGEAFAHDRIDG